MSVAHAPVTAFSATPQVGEIASRIFSLRGVRVMLSSDLARLYGVETRVLMQAVRRNINRFPPDFAFMLSPQEFADLKSQDLALRSHFVTSNCGGMRYPPMAFTEQSVAMLSGVLRSAEAVAVNIQGNAKQVPRGWRIPHSGGLLRCKCSQYLRVLLRLCSRRIPSRLRARPLAGTYSASPKIMRAFVKLRGVLSEHAELEQKLARLEAKYDGQFRVVFDAIDQLMNEPAPGGYDSRRIGFTKDT